MRLYTLAAMGAALLGSATAMNFDEDFASPSSQVRLVSQLDSFQPGKPFEVMLEIKHPEHWHSYYKNPASVGQVFAAQWQLPPGFTVSAPSWPTPLKGEAFGSVFYGYDNLEMVYTITPPADFKVDDKAKFSVSPTWQICKDSCLEEPSGEQKSWSIELAAGAQPEVNQGNAALIAQAQTKLPALTLQGWEFKVQRKSQEQLELVFKPQQPLQKALTGAYFFSSDNTINPAAEQSFSANQDGSYTLVLTTNPKKDDADYQWQEGADDKVLRGILTTTPNLAEAVQRKGVQLDLAVQGESAAVAEKQQNKSMSLGDLAALCLPLFLGGLILNLMPCVFPVIGLKVMSFVNMAGGERRKIIMHSLLFVFGVLVSFWLLTVLLIYLKTVIPNVNWAVWLENPWVVWVLLLIMLVMALSMYGLFEIGASATSVGQGLQQKKGYSGSFFSGVLATVVATPCSAPFLGTAIGPAMGLPSAQMFVAFTAMGLGMAFPYLVFGLKPSLIEKLPRPGAWMESFKQGMSFLLLLTAAWLVWTYSGSQVFQEEYTSFLVVLFSLVLVCAACWVYGRWCVMWRSTKAKRIGGVIAAVLLAAGVYGSSPYVKKTKIDWVEWSPQEMQRQLDSGKLVYVDFTARWCATCQVNKRVAYTPKTAELFEKYGIVAMRADKTVSNPTIDAELRRLKRSAVPVNALYRKGQELPDITPPMFTAEELQQFLSEQAGKQAK